MDENGRTAKQETPGASGVFAKFLNRIIDRLLPDDPKENISDHGKRWAIFAGLFLWCVYGGIVEYSRSGASSSTGEFERLPFVWEMIPGIFLVLLSFMLWYFIYRSFERGRPLTFFFLGLIFPTIALRMLRFAFST